MVQFWSQQSKSYFDHQLSHPWYWSWQRLSSSVWLWLTCFNDWWLKHRPFFLQTWALPGTELEYPNLLNCTICCRKLAVLRQLSSQNNLQAVQKHLCFACLLRQIQTLISAVKIRATSTMINFYQQQLDLSKFQRNYSDLSDINFFHTRSDFYVQV